MSCKLSQVFHDLKRRKVFRAAAIYVAVAWVVVQVASEFIPAFFLPDWTLTAVAALAIVGFPVTVVLAWLFDVGPTGVVRTRPGSAMGLSAIAISIALMIGATWLFVVIIVPEPVDESEAYVTLDYSPVDNSVAVLPFTNMSADVANEFFGDGIADVLIHRLAQIEKLHVIARTSSFAFKGKDTDMREIGRKLNVEAILEGSVQQSGGNLRIAAQLIDAQTGAHLWSKLFDRRDEDLFDIQDDIAVEVATAITQSVTDDEVARLTADITNNLDAYDYYVLGQNALYKTFEFHDAIEHFSAALELDPGFALAYAGLADANISLSWMPDDIDYVSRAKENVDKALEIDPELGEAHSAAVAYYHATDNITKGREHFQRAIAAAPSYVYAYVWFGNMLVRSGDLDEGLEVLEKGLSLNPIHPQLTNNLAWVYSERGNRDRSMELVVQVFENHRDDTQWRTTILPYIAMNATEGDRYDEAIAYSEVAMAIGGEEVMEATAPTLVFSYLVMGDLDKVELWRADLSADVNTDIWRDYVVLRLLKFSDDRSGLRVFADDIARLVESISHNPSFELSAAIAAEAYLYLGEYQRVVDLLGEANNPSTRLEWACWLAYAHSRLGNTAEAVEASKNARKIYEAYLSSGKNGSWHRLEMVSWFALQRDAEATIERLKDAYREGTRDHTFLKTSVLFDFVREDPRFVEIVTTMKADAAEMLQHVDQMYATGNWQDYVLIDLSDVTGLPGQDNES